MLTKEKRDENQKIYLGTLNKYEICSSTSLDKLIELGLAECPASTMTSLHGAFEGGLIAHSINVLEFLLQLNELLPKVLKCEKKSLIKIAFLHGIGKLNLYTPNPSEWHRKNLGKIYEFNENITSMSVAERSIYYITSYDLCKLNEDEYQAISNFDKNLDTNMAAKWHTKPMGVILRQAIELAIMKEKLVK